jgi:hypothetical protein
MDCHFPATFLFHQSDLFVSTMRYFRFNKANFYFRQAQALVGSMARHVIERLRERRQSLEGSAKRASGVGVRFPENVQMSASPAETLPAAAPSNTAPAAEDAGHNIVETQQVSSPPSHPSSPLQNVQVKKTHSNQYARVGKHGKMLSLFNLFIGLVEL